MDYSLELRLLNFRLFVGTVTWLEVWESRILGFGFSCSSGLELYYGTDTPTNEANDTPPTDGRLGRGGRWQMLQFLRHLDF